MTGGPRGHQKELSQPFFSAAGCAAGAAAAFGAGASVFCFFFALHRPEMRGESCFNNASRNSKKRVSFQKHQNCEFEHTVAEREHFLKGEDLTTKPFP